MIHISENFLSQIKVNPDAKKTADWSTVDTILQGPPGNIFTMMSKTNSNLSNLKADKILWQIKIHSPKLEYQLVKYFSDVFFPTNNLVATF